MPPASPVLIAPTEAQVREYMRTLSNWGRWGKDDELGTINVVGGFMITDRMLRMFKRQPAAKKDSTEERERG